MLLCRKISNRLPVRCNIDRALRNAEMLRNREPYFNPKDEELQEIATLMLAFKDQIDMMNAEDESDYIRRLANET